jgi:hydrogenase maturation protease
MLSQDFRFAERYMAQLDLPKVVLGLGNLICSDDAVGVLALRQLERDPRLPSNVILVEGGTKGLDLLPYICDASFLLVLDAVDVGAAPGTVFRIAGEEVSLIPGNGSAHDLALSDLLSALRMTGREPQEIALLGVQPLSTELGTTLSMPVQNALPSLTEAALTELSNRLSL